MKTLKDLDFDDCTLPDYDGEENHCGDYLDGDAIKERLKAWAKECILEWYAQEPKYYKSGDFQRFLIKIRFLIKMFDLEDTK